MDIALIVCMAAIVFCIFMLGFRLGWENGQKDALKGDQEFVLIEFPNGTRKIVQKDDLGKYGNSIKIIK